MNVEHQEIRRRLKASEEVRPLAWKMARRHRHDRSMKPVLALAESLWRSKAPDERMMALLLLEGRDRFLEDVHWKVFRRWMKQVRTVDLGDALARLFGALVMGDRSWIRVLRHWTQSKNPWERRMAVMSVLPRWRLMKDVEAGEFVCAPLREDRDPRVQEAVKQILASPRRRR